MTLDLSPQMETWLQEGAAREGLCVEDYLLGLVERAAADEAAVPTSPSEIVKYWERAGVYDAAPAGPDSPELVRQWREQEEGPRQSRLFGDR